MNRPSYYLTLFNELWILLSDVLAVIVSSAVVIHKVSPQISSQEFRRFLKLDVFKTKLCVVLYKQ